MKRTFTTIFWWLALTLIVTAAVIVSIAREMAPKATEYKRELEVYFSETVGLDVQIEQFELTWPGLAPELRLSGLSLREDQAGPVIVQVDHFVLQIDLLTSFWNGALSTRRGEVDGLRMSIRQHSDGRWVKRSDDAENAAPESATQTVIETLLRSNQLVMRDSRFTLITREGDEVPVLIEFADLQNSGRRHSVEAKASYGELSEPVSFSANFIGTPWGSVFQGNAYLDLRGQIIDEGIRQFAASEGFPIQLPDNLELDAQWWLRWSSINEFYTQGIFSLNYLPMPDDFQQFSVSDIRFRTDFQWRDQTQTSGWFRDISFTINDELIDIEELRVDAQLTGTGRFVTFATPRVGLDYLSEQLNRFPDSELKDVLNDLRPSGTLTDLQLRLPLDDASGFIFNANLDNVSVGAWGGAPAVSTLNGSVAADAFGGVVNIAGGPFTMHFPTIYERPFEFNQATGRVYWQVDTEAGAVLVGASDLKMAGDIGDMTGAFYLDGMMGDYTGPKRDSQLILQIGLDRSSVTRHRDLVPFVVSENLRSWLDDALVVGDLNEGDFLMRLDLAEGCGQCLGLQLTLDTQNVHLNYQPDWPTIENVRGRVYLDNDRLLADIDPVTYLGLNVFPETVSFVSNASSVLTIGVSADGLLRGVNSHLIETPLWPTLEPLLSRWDLNGHTEADIQIVADLSDDADFSYDLALTFDGATLHDNPLNLRLDDISGQLRIADGELSSDALRGEFWGHPAQISVASSNASVEVGFSGMMEAERLSTWSDTPFDVFMQGSAPFSGSYEFDFADGDQVVEIRSSLLGMSVDLPSQWSKPAAQVVESVLTIPLVEDGFDTELAYGNQLTIETSVREGNLRLARIHFGEEMPLEIGADIWVSANLERVDIPRYINWFSRKLDYFNSLSDIDIESSLALSVGGEVKASVLRVNDDLSFANADAKVFQLDDGLLVDLASTEATGTLRIPADDDRWEVRLDRLQIPEMSADEPAALDVEQPFRISDLSTLPPMDVTISQLSYAAEEYGGWSFNFDPLENGVRLSDISGSWNGLQIEAREDATEPLWISWREHDEAGDVTAINLSAFAPRFNETAGTMEWQLPFTAQSGHLDLRASWLGTPMEFNLSEIAADVDFDMNRGQLITTSAGSDLVRLFNIFNFNTWARRLQLDFDDLQRGGIAFDEMSGRFILDAGRLVMLEPIILDAPSSRFVMTGEASLVDSTVDANLNVTLPVGDNVAWITALAVSLPAAAGVFLASQLFEDQFDQLSTLSYRIEGSLDEPEVSFQRFFANDQKIEE